MCSACYEVSGGPRTAAALCTTMANTPVGVAATRFKRPLCSNVASRACDATPAIPDAPRHLRDAVDGLGESSAPPSCGRHSADEGSWNGDSTGRTVEGRPRFEAPSNGTTCGHPRSRNFVMVTAGRGKGVVVPPPLRVQLPWRRLSWHITSARGLGSHHLCRSRRLDSLQSGQTALHTSDRHAASTWGLGLQDWDRAGSRDVGVVAEGATGCLGVHPTGELRGLARVAISQPTADGRLAVQPNPTGDLTGRNARTPATRCARP